jgi:hypothetical protein
VVLPQPEGPSKVKNSPAWTDNETLLRISFWPYDLLTCLISIKGFGIVSYILDNIAVFIKVWIMKVGA